MVTATAHSVLDQIFDSLTDCLTPEVAQRIMDVELDPQAQSRINELAAKANQGTLSAEEREEYEGFIEAIDLLGIFHAKARLAMRQRQP